MSDDDGWHLPVGVPSGAVPSGGAPSGALLPGGAPLRSSSAAVPEDATPGVRSTDQAYRVRWVPNPPITAAIAAAVFLAGLALVTARVEFALVAAPLLVIAALGHDPARGRAGVIRTRTAVRPEDNGRGVMVDVELRAPQVAEAVAVVATLADGSTRRVLVTPSTAAALRGPVTVLHSGPQAVVRLDLALIAQGGTAVTLPEEGPTLRAVVPPPRLRIEQLPMPHRLVGTTGTHESSSRGDGGEFRDLALFAPGDRLRRIDWRRTARRAQQPGELYVRRTSSTADAVVVIVLDDRDDVGPDVTRWSGTAGPGRSATSLDLAREAATTLASAYIGAGDRVGFRDLAGAVTGIEPRGGVRQLDRLRSATARAVPTSDTPGPVRAPTVPAASLVVVLSTFLDDHPAAMAITWAATGRRVVAVDVLPPLDRSDADRQERVASRLVELERRVRFDRMRAAGVEPITWRTADGTPPAVAVRLLSRARRRP
ncbi:DUF58 domain-containing protein [Curtobacterium sp. MCBD17_035]|uniref:DUF58 domain-containing protein n=1 Tax=Curtobacterium sp. MCBD17_035 TaxID=2175673 RepID=UPI000DA7F932|nr:DUF58 domain-containing protein [Curtobacterium sp. MCBD17_035]WIB67619.1 DUF58 domain-containing protein [Curtobacterium sp. MCBD17_035]